MSEAPETKPKRNWHFLTVFIADARLGRGMLVGGAIYGILVLTGFPVMPCPWNKLTGLPCPGCGMTRSTFALLRGDFLESLRLNAFTWAILLFWLIVAIGITLPKNLRALLVARLGAWEDRSRWALWFLVILVIYTLTRWVGFW